MGWLASTTDMLYRSPVQTFGKTTNFRKLLSTKHSNAEFFAPQPLCSRASDVGTRSAAAAKASSGDQEDVIRRMTEITRESLTPEIALHLLTPHCTLWHGRGEESPFPDPFWAFYWPGGQALTRYILDCPLAVRNKTILDVGSGCGASAIACAMSGSKTVTANDICKVAASAIKINAELNGVSMEISTDDLIGQPVTCDVMLLGDMFYDDNFTQKVTEWVMEVVRNQTSVYIGDPGRVYLRGHPLTRYMECVAKYDLPEQCRLENNGMSTGYVWEIMNR